MKNLVVLSGAGMSAESGIATFRDSGGLWEQFRIEDVATLSGFRTDPKLVLDFYNIRRRENLRVTPNRGHLTLVDLEKYYNVTIITQNVDNLHEMAGSTRVLHLHGELMKSRSSINEKLLYDIDPASPDINIGDLAGDGSQLRPHIVWFGEPVPLIQDAEEIVRDADVFVIIGTSLNVYPAAGLLDSVKENVPIFLIDPNVVPVVNQNVTFINKGASEGVGILKNLLTKDSV